MRCSDATKKIKMKQDGRSFVFTYHKTFSNVTTFLLEQFFIDYLYTKSQKRAKFFPSSEIHVFMNYVKVRVSSTQRF